MAKGGVRILGGCWQGRRLEVPRGIRPSESRVREALFSIWNDRLEGARFLDLFAGSGAVGLEARSRGALHATLVDGGRNSLVALRRNCRGLAEGAMPSGVEIVKRRLPSGSGAPLAPPGYDLIFADPPYDFDDYESLLHRTSPWCRPGGQLVIEHSKRVQLPEVSDWRPLRERHYGETCLSFFEPAEPVGPEAEGEG